MENRGSRTLTSITKEDTQLYRPLASDRAEFRLLRLLDTSNTPLLQCELQPFSLTINERPLYKALSYQWGSNECSHKVQLNGHGIPIRKNLHDFLQQMFLEQRRDWMFIDALSINQDDDEEKAQQVNLMGHIYRDAEEVLAWILREPFSPVNGHRFAYDEVINDPGPDHTDSLEEVKSLVLHSSFWSRLWIVQEVLLAKRLSIRLGSAEVEWMNLIPEKTIFTRRCPPRKNETMLTQTHGTDPQENRSMALHLLSWRRFERHKLRSGHRFPFHKAVDFFATQECTRPHDKIFGILGLANSRITVDYTISVIDLFMATLADYFLSLGFLTDNWKGLRKRMGLMKMTFNIKEEMNLMAPFMAFGLNPFDPVVYLVIHEIAEFFVPGWGKELCREATQTWWYHCRPGPNMATKIVDMITGSEPKMEFKYIASICVAGVKLLGSELSSYQAQDKATRADQVVLKKNNAGMTAPTQDRETKTYQQWVLSARAISQNMWERYQDSGEDADGDIDDESWTMIG